MGLVRSKRQLRVNKNVKLCDKSCPLRLFGAVLAFCLGQIISPQTNKPKTAGSSMKKLMLATVIGLASLFTIGFTPQAFAEEKPMPERINLSPTVLRQIFRQKGDQDVKDEGCFQIPFCDRMTFDSTRELGVGRDYFSLRLGSLKVGRHEIAFNWEIDSHYPVRNDRSNPPSMSTGFGLSCLVL